MTRKGGNKGRQGTDGRPRGRHSTALMANTGDEANAAGRTDSMNIVHCTVDAGSDDTLLDGYLSSATVQKKKQRPIFQILVIHKCFALTTW